MWMPILFNGLYLVTMIYFDAQITPDLANGSFWVLLAYLQYSLSTFLLSGIRGCSRSILCFPTLESTISPKSPNFF